MLVHLMRTAQKVEVFTADLLIIWLMGVTGIGTAGVQETQTGTMVVQSQMLMDTIEEVVMTTENGSSDWLSHQM